MELHLIDGTYELFRNHYALPGLQTSGGREVGATRGLLRTLNVLLREEGATHVACAFDHEIESFRNDLFDGYKTGEGIEPELLAQFPLAERAAEALGITVWPMTTFEADDALHAAAERFSKHPELDRVVICSVDKDLAQSVRGTRVVLRDRRRNREYDEAGVREKYGVDPGSIPDYLALVGDKADGIPGIPRWGKKSSSTVLAVYPHLDDIPRDPDDWDLKVRGRAGLASNLFDRWEAALLYRKLATLRSDVPIDEELEDLAWQGPDEEKLAELCREIEDDDFLDRVERI